MPAQLTRICSFPHALSAAATTLRQSSIEARSACTKRVSHPALVNSRDNSLATLLIAAADDNASGATASEQAGDRLAQPLGAAGHYGILSGKLIREI